MYLIIVDARSISLNKIKKNSKGSAMEKVFWVLAKECTKLQKFRNYKNLAFICNSFKVKSCTVKTAVII